MTALLDGYRRYRATLDTLSQTIADTLSAETISAAAAAIGVSIAPSEPDRQRALADLSLHWRSDATQPSAVERYRASLTTAPGWETALVLQALAHAPYRLLHVTRCQPSEARLTMRDALRSETLEVIDQQLSATVEAGVTLGGRILILPELCMSTGALLPATRSGLERLEAALKRGALPSTATRARDLSSYEAEQVGVRIVTALLGTAPTAAARTGRRGRR